MKHTLLILIAFLFSVSVRGQIFLENTYYGDNDHFFLIKLQYSGYKYCSSITGSAITLYNLDHSLYKQIPFPNMPANASSLDVGFITETLFDTDSSDIEYLLTFVVGGAGGTWQTRICDENGNILFSKDTATLQLNDYSFFPPHAMSPSIHGIYNTDQGAKMILIPDPMLDNDSIYVYNLPGLLECNVCDGQRSTNTGMVNGANSNTAFKVYPNPTNSFTFIDYQLPPDVDKANLLIFDAMGLEVSRREVNKSSTRITVPTNAFAQGSYFYALDIPGKGLSAKKVLIIH
ncbi:MAG: T9SS type A sorting domain-containing protein [Chitinophagales bacterium]